MKSTSFLHKVIAVSLIGSLALASAVGLLASPASASTVTIYGQTLEGGTPTVLDPGSSPDLTTLLSDAMPDGVTQDSTGDMFIVNIVGSLTTIPGASTTSLFGQSVTANTPVDLLSGSLDPLLSDPYGVTIDNQGDLFIVNSGNHTVVVLPAPGVTSIFGQTVTPDTPTVLLPSTLTPLLSDPGAIAIDASGDLFVGNGGTSNVVVVPATGTTSLFGQSVTANAPAILTSMNSVVDPMGFAFDAAGDLFVSDEEGGDVTVLPAAGTTSVFGQTVTADVPSTLDPGTPGSLASLVADGSMGLSFDGAGNLYIETNNATLVVVPATTTSLFGQSVLADTPTEVLPTLLPALLMGPMGIHVDSAGDVFLTDYIASDLVVVANGAPNSQSTPPSAPSTPPAPLAPVSDAVATISGQSLSANWTAPTGATSYTCTLLSGTNPTVTTTSTTCSFSGISTAGSFEVEIVANYGSASSSAVLASALAPSPPSSTPPPTRTKTPPPTPIDAHVYFSTASSALSASARDSLRSFAVRARQHHDAHISVVGYSDPQGVAAANLVLSLQRARSVAANLKSEFASLGYSVTITESGRGVATNSNFAADRFVNVTT